MHLILNQGVYRPLKLVEDLTTGGTAAEPAICRVAVPVLGGNFPPKLSVKILG